ncbi:MAG: hypothetical protein RIR53_1849 [Bacteroidota bacterium]|jgi:hypothetical protein
MIRFLSLIIISSLLTSCVAVPTVHQHNLECHTQSKAEVVRSVVRVLVEHNFTITFADTLAGVVYAGWDARGVPAPITYSFMREWKIFMADDLGDVGMIRAEDQEEMVKPKPNNAMYVIATARHIPFTMSLLGPRLRYCNDTTSKDELWYWNVRKELESLCSAKTIITTKPLD